MSSSSKTSAAAPRPTTKFDFFDIDRCCIFIPGTRIRTRNFAAKLHRPSFFFASDIKNKKKSAVSTLGIEIVRQCFKKSSHTDADVDDDDDEHGRKSRLFSISFRIPAVDEVTRVQVGAFLTEPLFCNYQQHVEIDALSTAAAALSPPLSNV